MRATHPEMMGCGGFSFPDQRATAARIGNSVAARVRTAGKFFEVDRTPWALKGFTYGPFAPNVDGEFLPDRPRLLKDLRHMRQLGANCFRLYHVPGRRLLDDAAEAGLRVFVDVPWEKHRCFFEEWAAQESALTRLRQTARDVGNHPAVFAISVGNEIPKDVVRFYGAARVQRFIDRLIDTVKQEAPGCLATYTNYPSTEFLVPASQDFYCVNLYLEDGEVLGRYLDHIQHVAGAWPVVLGEYGMDSYRHGPDRQSSVLERHVREVNARGLAGSFVFAYTDDWYTGGAQVEDWAFGVTDRQRREKPAARALSDAWSTADAPVVDEAPLVTVAVCSYNGSATLRECLRSLERLEYPNYEVVLVDDGSTDDTPRIAADFPSVRYVRQDNMGLSVARNVAAATARGEIVAYTDDDCVAHEAWLTHLVRAMREQGVEAIGGPNLPPASDGWVARCVAASPGGPSHVMLDDRRAEHVPGCNMAFRRSALLGLGGFDAQFRVAGDDVDICWRFLDAGMSIGFAPSALVWHHRRKTVGAYLRQQRGYGRSEAMLRFKHARRFNALGCSRWNGVIYGEGAVGLPVCAPVVYHGKFGSGLFQTVYRNNDYSAWGYFTLLEWHALAVMAVTITALAAPPLALVAVSMWGASLVAALRSAARAPLPRQGTPWWCRPLVFVLHLAQPVVRSWHRYRYRLARRRLPDVPAPTRRVRPCVKRVSFWQHDLYWESRCGLGREQLLDALQAGADKVGWTGTFDDEWGGHDVELVGDLWHNARIHTATEELGRGRRFTRVRCLLRPAGPAVATAAVLVAWAAVALVTAHPWVAGGALLGWLAFATLVLYSQHRCRDRLSRLVWRAGRAARLDPVPIPRAPKLSLSAARRPSDEPAAPSNAEADPCFE